MMEALCSSEVSATATSIWCKHQKAGSTLTMTHCKSLKSVTEYNVYVCNRHATLNHKDIVMGDYMKSTNLQDPCCVEKRKILVVTEVILNLLLL
jgi:hypothetical protein